MKASAVHWRNDTDGVKQPTSRKTCRCATLSTRNLTSTRPGSKPGRRVWRPEVYL